jgi:hypothetical protein
MTFEKQLITKKEVENDSTNIGGLIREARELSLSLVECSICLHLTANSRSSVSYVLS